MSIKNYLKSKTGTIALNIIALIVLSLFLLSIGNEFKAILIIVLAWIVTLSIYMFISYRKRRDYFYIRNLYFILFNFLYINLYKK